MQRCVFIRFLEGCDVLSRSGGLKPVPQHRNRESEGSGKLLCTIASTVVTKSDPVYLYLL